MLVLSKKDVESLIDMESVLKVVEHAFRECGVGKAKMPPKLYLDLPEYNGDFRAMPGFVNESAGIKWVNVHPDNRKKNLPTVMAVVILNDPKTGEPLMTADGSIITNYRTGAAAGVASKYLARKDSKTMGIVGAGAQSVTQLMAVSKIFKLEKVKIFDMDNKAIERFKGIFPNMDIEKFPIEKLMESDIVSTVTPVRKPIVKKEWVHDGIHINAIGADAKGKEELEPGILKKARIVVDDIEQASHSGEINVPISKKIITKKNIYATLGEIVAGKKKGRTGNEITVFDSTGLAIQDIATSKMLYEKAKKKGIGTWIE